MTSKWIFSELIGKSSDEAGKQSDTITALAIQPVARTTLLYPFASTAAFSPTPKSLLPSTDIEVIKSIIDIRSTTSKKNPTLRRQELVRSQSPPLLSAIASNAKTLAETSFGCGFMTEVLLAAEGDRSAAFHAIADLAAGDPQDETHVSRHPPAGRMLKTLVQGGHYDAKEKTVRQVQPSAEFCDMLFAKIKRSLIEWATGPGAFIILALVEQDNWAGKDELITMLKSRAGTLKKAVKEAGNENKGAVEDEDAGMKSGRKASLAGMKLLLERLG